MQYDIITIFPKILDSYFNESILKRAQRDSLISIKTHNLRDYTKDKHKNVDDTPYGGGPGMVLMAEPIYRALKDIRKSAKGGSAFGGKKSKVIMLDPAGKQFNQKIAQAYSKLDQLIFICGRYEGIDARVNKYIDEKISIGPYVLSGGELPAMLVTEATARLIPGYMGNPKSLVDESHNDDMLEYPQYTRPEEIKINGKKISVPKVLLSGDHGKIKEWK